MLNRNTVFTPLIFPSDCEKVITSVKKISEKQKPETSLFSQIFPGTEDVNYVRTYRNYLNRQALRLWIISRH
ncbi:MAG: hypothetical protein BWK80_35345 [Desulfobacteraceae bacterium IS3]|nr:MAG: hypothetical protein BWK80_35345 [Desulfobacteraceae bacterium IS3]